MTRSYAEALRRKWDSRVKVAATLYRLGIISKSDYNDMIDWTEFIVRFFVFFIFTLVLTIIAKGIINDKRNP